MELHYIEHLLFPFGKKYSENGTVSPGIKECIKNKSLKWSYGIILFWYDSIRNEVYYLIIQKRDTFAYIDLLTGRKTYKDLNTIISQMAVFERQKLLKYDRDVLLDDIIKSNKLRVQLKSKVSNYPDKDTIQKSLHSLYTAKRSDLPGYNIPLSKRKLHTLGNIMHVNNSKEVIEGSLKPSKNSNSMNLVCEFPKGRKNRKESQLQCALREFKEETNLNIDIYTVENIGQLYDVYEGTDGIWYATGLYIARCMDNRPLPIKTVKSNLRPISVSKEAHDVFWLKFKDTLHILDIRQYLLLKSVEKFISTNINSFVYRKFSKVTYLDAVKSIRS